MLESYGGSVAILPSDIKLSVVMITNIMCWYN